MLRLLNKQGPGRTSAVALAAGVLLFLLIGALFASGKGKDMPPYVSFSADTDGVKAIRTLLEGKKDTPVKEWRQPWVKLPTGNGHTLLAVEPTGVDPKERQAALEWIERGNHLVWMSQSLNGLEAEGVQTTMVKEAESPSTSQEPVKVTHYTKEGVLQASLNATRPTTSRRLILSGTSGSKLLSDEQGLLGVRISQGDGSLTVLLVPEWLRNDTILSEEHFALVWPLLMEATDRTGIFYWDEFHHGYKWKPGLLGLYPNWLLAVYLQLAAALLFLLWRKGKRFGPVVTPREWKVRRGDETLLAVAGWHRRRQLRKEAIMEQSHYLKQLQLEKWGLRISADPEERALAAEIHGGSELAGKVREWGQRMNALEEGGRYTDKAFLQDGSLISDIAKALEKE